MLEPFVELTLKTLLLRGFEWGVHDVDVFTARYIKSPVVAVVCTVIDSFDK